MKEIREVLSCVATTDQLEDSEVWAKYTNKGHFLIRDSCCTKFFDQMTMAHETLQDLVTACVQEHVLKQGETWDERGTTSTRNSDK